MIDKLALAPHLGRGSYIAASIVRSRSDHCKNEFERVS